MKKYFPLLIFIIAFSGFLSSQIIWDTYHLNAQNVEQDKQKHSVYEAAFQGLKLTTTKKTTVELKEEKSPVILLNFWASWCVPCLKEFPSLVQFQEKFKGKVKVIGVNGGEDAAKAPELVKKVEDKQKLNFESTLDADSAIANKFLVTSYPVSIVFHRGKVVYVSKRIHNFMDESFVSLVEGLVKE